MTEFYDSLETRSSDQRTSDLVSGIREQLVHARDNTEAYAASLQGHDCEGFGSLDQLAGFPVTRKSELMERQKQQPPLGGFAVIEPGQLRYINVSPGPVYEACTHRSDFWRMARPLYAAGFRAGDLVHNCFSYHLTPAGMMLDSGCQALGCGVIPGGVGQTEMQVQTINDLKPNGYVGTPSFLKIILEKADELELDVSSITRGLVSGEALPAPLRQTFQERGITVLQAYATADLGVIAYESIADDGLVIDEGVYVEIVRPGSGDPVADGEVGEVLVTSLNPDYPLIRFATGDMSMIIDGTSECGRTNRRIRGWMGRADQTAKVRGMFIHPEQINGIVKRHPEVLRARLVIDWVNQQDEMALHCETAAQSAALEEAIGESIRDLCKVRGDVVLVDPGSIANDGIVIEDVRKYQ
jgi:phenylacetate-CoA ligase